MSMNWVKKLDKVGCPILADLDEILNLDRQISKLKIQKLKKERTLYKIVKELWKPKEIKAARESAIKNYRS